MTVQPNLIALQPFSEPDRADGGAAADIGGRAGGESGGPACEDRGGPGHTPCPADASYGDRAGELLELRTALRNDVIKQVGLHRSGRRRIDRDAMACCFERPGPR